ncbi:MAG: hypothetical protein ACRDFB_07230, partial [Rhabdochlamydiaceae bacterium]
MSLVLLCTYYYLRTWKKDFLVSEQASKWLQNGATAARIALPFIALYQPAGTAISWVTGTWKLGSHIFHLKSASSEEYGHEIKGLVKTAAECMATSLNVKYGLLVHHLLDFWENFTSKEPAFTKAFLGLSNLFYIALFFKGPGYKAILVSLVFQATLDLCHMCLEGYEIYHSDKGWKQQKSLDALAHGLMGMIRLYQAYDLREQIRKTEKLLKEIALFSKAKEEKKSTPMMVSACAASLPEVSDPTERAVDDVISAAPKRNINNAALEGELDTIFPSPFSQMIENHKETVTDVKGIEHDLGVHVHGFGKGVVKGMNLTFKNKTLNDGRQVTELTFELNHVHREQVDKVLQQFPHRNSGLKIET